MHDLLHTLTARLDAGSSDRARLSAYYAGTNELTYLSPEARAALNNRLSRVSANIPRVLVDSIAERLRITGFVGADVWPSWARLHGHQIADQVHREAMIAGDAFVIVWADNAGRATMSAESADQVAVLTDPATGRVTSAVKRWSTDSQTFAVVYEPDQITTYRADVAGATSGGFTVTSRVDNPLGVVNVVPFVNTGRLLEPGRSEMETVIPLADANTKLLTDLLTASEYAARPRRWASGIELTEDAEGNAVNPFGETDRFMIGEEVGAKFGQLAGSDLAGYEKAVGVIMRQVSAVSGLPEHALGIGGDQPTSADSIRASEAALTAKAEAKQRTYGKSWAEVARLLAAVDTDTDPASVSVSVKWSDPSTRSEAQQADAVTKLFAAGLLPASVALARLGYSDDEIADIRTARRAEAIDGAGIDLGSLAG